MGYTGCCRRRYTVCPQHAESVAVSSLCKVTQDTTVERALPFVSAVGNMLPPPLMPALLNNKWIFSVW
jgi:hypothetical protein